MTTSKFYPPKCQLTAVNMRNTSVSLEDKHTVFRGSHLVWVALMFDIQETCSTDRNIKTFSLYFSVVIKYSINKHFILFPS